MLSFIPATILSITTEDNKKEREKGMAKLNQCIFYQAAQDDVDEDSLSIRVNQDVRLDNRVLDLRTPANQAIFRSACKSDDI